MVKRARYVFANDEVVETAIPPIEFTARSPGRAGDRPPPHGGYVESKGALIPIGIYL